MKRKTSIPPAPGIITVMCMAVLLLFASQATAQTQQNLEYKIKAAFLFNFAKFVEWPGLDDTNSLQPFCIGVLGNDPFGPELESIQKKQIHGRPIQVKHFRNPEEITSCHLVFIGFKEKKEVDKSLKKLDGKTVLTVGELEGFTRTGGMIGFIRRQNKIRFEINPKAAENAGLTISSKLLKLATIVRTQQTRTFK